MPCRVLISDPPWDFGDPLPGKGRGAGKHYACLSVSDIQRFPLPPFEDHAVLFLWRVSSMVEEAYQVCRAWGFVPKSEIVWVKTPKSSSPEAFSEEEPDKLHMGMGRIVRGAHETCLVAVRGRMEPIDKSVRTVFFAPVGEHSAKPDAFYELVEKLFPLGTPGEHVELFARKARTGWTVYGNEAGPEAVAAPSPSPSIPVLPWMSESNDRIGERLHEAFEIRKKGLGMIADFTPWKQIPSDKRTAWAAAVQDVLRNSTPQDGRLCGLHLIDELGHHPSLTPKPIRHGLTDEAVQIGLVPSGLLPNEAWIRLQAVAPVGWIRDRLRTPAGHINNCALANHEEEKSCPLCEGKCPDRKDTDPKAAPSATSATPPVAADPAATPKKRGRPRKNPLPEEARGATPPPSPSPSNGTNGHSPNAPYELGVHLAQEAIWQQAKEASLRSEDDASLFDPEVGP